MKTPKHDQLDDFLIDESDEYLLKMADELKHDLSDIKVSEDLIARTLAKISEQTRDDVTKTESNMVPIKDIKAPVKYRRSFQWMKPLSVAVAACLLLILGANAVNNGLFIGNKKESSDSSAYDMRSYGASEKETTAKEDKGFKSSEVAEANREEAVVLEKEQYDMTNVTPSAITQEFTDAHVNGALGVETTAYSRALEAATSAAGEQGMVYEFPQSSEDSNTLSLLSLLTSKDLSVTSEEAEDEWKYYLVFSLGEEDAITYQIGKSEFIIATSYHGTEEASQVTYQMKNVDKFLESLTGYLE